MLAYADLIAGAFGILAAIALGIPTVRAIKAKRYWEGGQILSQEQSANPDNARHVQDILQRIEGLQLGGAKEALIWNLVGYCCLAISFLFLIAAAIDRHATAPDPASSQNPATGPTS